MKKFAYLLSVLLALIPAAGVQAQDSAEAKDPDQLYAVIETERGTMEFLLYKSVAPITVSSFVNLATRGFYDGLTFHRVVDGFITQGGDPNGDGTGGPGYEFEDEIRLHHNQEGMLSMANSGPNTNGSQFFITHVATPNLNDKHTVFGKIISGREIIRQIRQGDVIESITIEGKAKAFLERHADRVEDWNRSLDFLFPKLRKSLID